MKKFFVALLVLAIAAGNVFAEVTWGGRLYGKWNVVAGESGKWVDNGTIEKRDSKWLTTGLGASDPYIHTRVDVNAKNEEGTWGGFIRIVASSGDASSVGWIWWKPISQIEATLGMLDGFRPFGNLGILDPADFLGYGSYAAATSPAIYDANQGFSLKITPIANLAIGLSTPIGPAKVAWDDDNDKDTDKVDANQPAEVSYRRIGGWVNYTVEGVGDFALGFKGSSKDYTNGTNYGNNKLADASSTIHFGANVTAVENLKLQFSALYPIPADTDGADVKDIKSVQNPITLALAADYTVPDVFGVRALASVKLGGKTEYEASNSKPLEKGLVIAATLDPWVNVGVGTLGLFLTLQSTGADKKGDSLKNDKFDLLVAPYFAKSYGGGSLFVSFKLGLSNYLDASIKDGDGDISWAIPIVLVYGF